MFTFRSFLALVFLIFFLISCSSSNSNSYDFSENPAAHGLNEKRFIVKSARITIEVSTPEETAKEISALLENESGYIEYTHNQDKRHINLSIKIPENILNSFISKIESKGTVLSKSISSRDVTGESIDINARLKNLISLREKFRSLLDKAQNVTEILAIEKELSRIQSELDSIQGRQKLLQNQVAFSKIDLSIKQETIYGPLGYLGKGVYWVFKKLFVIQ